MSSFMQVNVFKQEFDMKGKGPLTPIGDGQPKMTKEPNETWKKPPEGWTKLNVDVSYF